MKVILRIIVIQNHLDHQDIEEVGVEVEVSLHLTHIGRVICKETSMAIKNNVITQMPNGDPGTVINRETKNDLIKEINE